MVGTRGRYRYLVPRSGPDRRTGRNRRAAGRGSRAARAYRGSRIPKPAVLPYLQKTRRAERYEEGRLSWVEHPDPDSAPTDFGREVLRASLERNAGEMGMFAAMFTIPSAGEHM